MPGPMAPLGSQVAPSASANQGPRRLPPSEGVVPGELGFWVFIFGELVMFVSFFVFFGYMRTRGAANFHAGQEALSIPIGTANTFLLLTGSLLVVQGVHAARTGRTRTVSMMVL